MLNLNSRIELTNEKSLPRILIEEESRDAWQLLLLIFFFIYFKLESIDFHLISLNTIALAKTNSRDFLYTNDHFFLQDNNLVVSYLFFDFCYDLFVTIKRNVTDTLAGNSRRELSAFFIVIRFLLLFFFLIFVVLLSFRNYLP